MDYHNTSSDHVMRAVCPVCNEKMVAQTRPPKLKHCDGKQSLATNYCVCLNCGSKAKAVITVTLINNVTQEDWVNQANL